MRHPAGETVTVTRLGVPTGANDEQGNPILGPNTTFTISDVALAPSSGVAGQQSSQEETTGFGIRTVTGYVLYCPYGTSFLPSDRLRIRGVDGWQVEGETAVSGWRNPFDGVGRGVVVSVKRAS